MLGRNVAAFPSLRNRPRDWTTQELAEFYRVESALIQGGMGVVTDRGLTDEGDPWFVFCREDDSEPVAHFARIDGQYLIASPAYSGVARGHDFRSMVQDLLSRHRLTPRSEGESSNVLMHPAALLIVVVGTAFFKTPGQAKADESHKDGDAVTHKTDAGAGGASAPGLAWTVGALASLNSDSASQSGQNWNDEQLAIASAVVFAASAFEQTSAPMVAASAADQWLSESSDSGFNPGHSSFVQSVLAELEASVASADFTPIKAAGSSTGWLYADVASTLDLMAKLSHIPPAHQTGVLDSAELSASAPLSASPSTSDYALLATKAFMGGPSLGVAAPLAAFVDALQNVDHAGTAPSQPSANVVYHEDATVVDFLPAGLTSLPSYASVVVQSGSADAFLAENNIFVSLQFSSAAQTVAQVQSALSNSVSAATAEVAVVDHPTMTQTGAASSQTASAGAQNLVISTGAGNNSNEVLTATQFIETLDLFLSETPNASVVVSQQKYVFASPHGTNGASSVLESVTMTFNDGSSISIVGQQQTLHDLVTHVQ
jgi:hypothetical protein